MTLRKVLPWVVGAAVVWWVFLRPRALVVSATSPSGGGFDFSGSRGVFDDTLFGGDGPILIIE